MKGKILSLLIILVMLLGSFGAVGTNFELETEDDCGCNGYYLDYAEEYEGLTSEEISAFQKQAEAEGWTFEIGENPATQYSLDDICGLVVPDGWDDNAHFDNSDITVQSSLPSYYDVRRADPENKNSNFLSNFPPAKNQGNCGSCWAFATVGVLEINIRLKENKKVDLSEQYLVSCNTNGWDCDGGWWAHDYHEWKEGRLKDGVGAVMESDFGYVSGQVGHIPSCKSCEHKYLIRDWGYAGGQHSTPSVSKIKQAIMDYDSVSVAVCANTAMQLYTGGVFNGCSNAQINHAVVLVGWDDTQGDEGVWIMRNSWGTGWGEEGGYMRIPYGCSSIGYSACYVEYEPQHTVGKRLLEVEIHEVTNHPDDGEFEPIDPLFNKPEWYYRVGAEVDGENIYQYNYHRDLDGWWIFAWYSNYRWEPEETHLFYVDDLSEVITIKLMDEDLWPDPDDLADVSEYPDGGEQNGAENENRGAIYHGTYDLKTNSLTGDPKNGPFAGYYTTIGDGNENAKVWFKIYDPVMAYPGGPYQGVENVEVEFKGSAVQYSGHAPYTYHWDFGDESTSTKQNPNHKYSDDGDYTATLTVTDDYGDSHKADVEVTIYSNTAPNKPSISGPSSGKRRQEYSFTFTATDSEGGYGDRVKYGVDWGDGSSVEWTDFVSSGTGTTLTHTWSSRDSFTIKAKTKDLNGAESSWATKSFSTPKAKTTNIPLMRFLETLSNLFPWFEFILMR